MTSNAQDSYAFGRFHIDARTRRLSKDGVQVPLSPRAFDLLTALAASEGLVLTKEELMNQLWPDVNVGEHNLTQTISVLRKSLGETPGAYRHIMTVPGRGYRFVRSVEPVERSGTNGPLPNDVASAHHVAVPTKIPATNHFHLDHPLLAGCLIVGIMAVVFIASAWHHSAFLATHMPSVSMAVLPFKNLDAESARTKLGAAFTDGLIRRLSEDRRVKISPMSDVLKYECPTTNLVDAGRELGVDSVVEGRVQKVDGKVRVTVQMVKVTDGTTQWTAMFDGNITDSFSLEDEMSEKLAPGITKAAYR
jgi:DNA-binding winged helix-turn-helix (wHTH) protein/TolB-like protein